MLNNKGKDTKQNNYYNSWSNIKHLLVGSIRISELGKFKLLEDQLHLRFIRSSTAERKEQLHDKNEKIKTTRRYFPKSNNLYKLLILHKETNDKKCKLTLFCWEILPTILRYQYLGLYTKFDHFLSKFRDLIKMIGNYYIYYNDQTFSFQKRWFR